MQYLAPESTDDAVAALAGAPDNAWVLAGGSDLLVRMKTGFIEPELIVDIKRIAAMQRIENTADGFIIGAAVSCAAMNAHHALVATWPGVVEAAGLIGSDQIQSRCTIVGNLCNASPAADSVPALVAAGAAVNIVGPNGRRSVAVEAFPQGPGKNCLEAGEMVESIHLPARAAHAADAYLRFIPRTEMDIAVVSAGVNLTRDAAGTVTTARVALGAVGPTVMLVDAAADTLIGTRLDAAALQALQAACSDACRPIDDKRGTVAYRTRVAGVLARRAATMAYNRAGAHH